LTYRPPFCTDAAQLRADVAAFFRRLRAETGGEAFPYLWVPELHADGERFHVHFAVGRFIGRGLIESAWGHGFVHIKLLSDLPIGSGRWEEARKAAGYLSKYVSKTFQQEGEFGRHRYEVAQGFQPHSKILTGTSRESVIAMANHHMGGPPVRIWVSTEAIEWQGPPSVWLSWA
jgi:hypothetical protein